VKERTRSATTTFALGGRRALVAYAQHLGDSSLTAEVETAATDLLSDLRHLFDVLGID